jgi:hypothetical protein
MAQICLISVEANRAYDIVIQLKARFAIGGRRSRLNFSLIPFPRRGSGSFGSFESVIK